LEGLNTRLKQRFNVLSWNQVYELLIELAERVEESGFSPNIIVGISRGGLVPSRILSDLLDNPELAIIRVRSYLDLTEKMEEPIVTQPVSAPVEGKSVLIVDDVADTGESLRLVYERLRGKAKETGTLTMYYKPWSCLKPDFYAMETRSWIVFPWELHETVKRLGGKIIEGGGTLEGVKAELIRTGLASSIVERFVGELWEKERR
jgi:hypoxanthine phosphoribosyltransferase